ncbi:hypothetical protein AB0E69_32500 [Kribbella sp. NPDC026611]|uniref:hypothetical protein n=1 Tax=Kribbella sp. NPDC026611 TaxID=3154911 RepID=UPI0033C7D771
MIASRAVRLTMQVALLLALLAGSAFVLLRPYLNDDERLFDEGRIDTVLKQGPVTVGHVEYKLDSLKVYSKLADKDGEEISVGAPAGSVYIVALLTVTPREGLYLKDKGFRCDVALRDDRGNSWSEQQAYGFPYPTYCSDNDHPFTMDKPGQVAQIFTVPASAVPHLTGVVVDDLGERRRVLITP